MRGLEMELSLLRAAGIDAGKMTPVDAYLAAGRILNDSELTRNSVMRGVDREEVLREMSPADRVALRERVTGVVTLKKPN